MVAYMSLKEALTRYADDQRINIYFKNLDSSLCWHSSYARKSFIPGKLLNLDVYNIIGSANGVDIILS